MWHISISKASHSFHSYANFIQKIITAHTENHLTEEKRKEIKKKTSGREGKIVNIKPSL